MRVGPPLTLLVSSWLIGCGEPIVLSGMPTTGATDDGSESGSNGPPPVGDTGDDTSSGVCGDGMITLPEQCDGLDVGGKTCGLFGLEDGPAGLSCTPACELDFSGCARCGDDIAQTGEACDGADVRGETCASQGFDDGSIACTADCMLDVSGCVEGCGNGIVDFNEQCDTAMDFACEDLGPGWTGEARCDVVDDPCQWAEYDCSLCGDGEAGGDEACDGSTLGPNGVAWTCTSTLGFPSQGTVACNASCEVDTSACSLCGNGFVDEGEACDGFVPGGITCEDFGHSVGFVACTPGCTLDASGCTSCGDGGLDPGESCDGTDLGGTTCIDLGFLGGTLGCALDCAFDPSQCGSCGDGIAVGSEACDGADLGGSICADVVPGAQAGTPTCAPDCTLDGAGCIAIEPGDLVISEILSASAAMPNAVAGQWFEIHNPGDQAWNLQGCEIQSVNAVETFSIDTSVPLDPQGFATFGSGTADVLGFVPTVPVPPGFGLLNGGDTIRLVCGPTVVDEVTYDDMKPWPAFVAGTAIALLDDALDAVLNDAGESWCSAGTVYALDQLGTPGAPNVCG